MFKFILRVFVVGALSVAAGLAVFLVGAGLSTLFDPPLEFLNAVLVAAATTAAAVALAGADAIAKGGRP